MISRASTTFEASTASVRSVVPSATKRRFRLFSLRPMIQ